MIVTVTGDVTTVVLMLKFGDTVAPAGTVTEGGTEATAGLSLLNATTTPPPGAAEFSVTLFELAGNPPATEAGDSVSTAGPSGLTTSMPVLLTPA